MNRIDESKHFSKDKTELAGELEAMYSVIAERLNFILDRVIEVDGETGLEIIKPGNEAGDDENWFVTVDSSGDFLFKHKESGAWVRRDIVHNDGTFTGDVAVTGDLTVDTDTLVVDAVNHRVGIGTATPSGKLSVAGGQTDSAYFFYDNDDVGAAEDGQSLYLYRKAAVGDKYLRMYIDQWGHLQMHGVYNNVVYLGHMKVADDKRVVFGDHSDYHLVYDSGNTRFELNSADVDGVGTDGTIFLIADGTDDVLFNGKIAFTQTDLNEYIDSLADGYINYGATILHKFNNAIGMLERSSDPPEPAEGNCVVWMSDGTGKGDDGDVLIASKAGGTTNWGTLFDHSGGAAW